MLQYVRKLKFSPNFFYIFQDMIVVIQSDDFDQSQGLIVVDPSQVRVKFLMTYDFVWRLR